jgi:preprotein translocase subunit SecE
MKKSRPIMGFTREYTVFPQPFWKTLARVNSLWYSMTRTTPGRGFLKPAMFILTKNPVVRYFLDVRDEVKKVTWPTQKQALMYSGFVVGACVVLGVYFGLVDELLSLGLQALVRLTTRS